MYSVSKCLVIIIIIIIINIYMGGLLKSVNFFFDTHCTVLQCGYVSHLFPNFSETTQTLLINDFLTIL